MLSYLILTTRALIMAAAVSGSIVGFTKLKGEKSQRFIVWISVLLGTLMSLTVAVLRNTTSLVDSAILNGWIYAFSLTSLLIYLIFLIKPLKDSKNRVLSKIPFVLLGILIFTVIAYASPEVWA